MLKRLTCATPAYLERFGVPANMESLAGHRVVGIRSITTGNLASLDFVDGAEIRSFSLPSVLSVTGTESYLAGIRLGLGLAQVPRFHIEADLKNGALVSILENFLPPSVPVSLLYPRSRQLSPRVRVFLDWAAREFTSRGD